MENVSQSIDPATNSAAQGQTGTATTQEQAKGLANSAINSASNAMENAKNSKLAQDLANGPAATSVKNQAAATNNEFADLANSRRMPQHTAANDTPLTHYHSFFFNLFSWKNPRATGITFASVLSFIFAARYLPVLSWSLKLTWMTLLVVTAAETVSKFALGSSVTTTIRPRRYFKIPKETLEATLDDVEQLINFFVIESQRIVFAENLAVTAAAFITAFLSYYLIALLPAWGFALFSTCVVFLFPLVYTQNKELIDGHLEHATNVVGEQTKQLRDLTAEHTNKGLESVKQYAGDYGNIASEYIGKSRQKIPAMTNGTTSSSVKNEDFPTAPQSDLGASSAEHNKPVLSSPGDGAPIAVSAS